MNPKKYTRYLEAVTTSLLDERYHESGKDDIIAAHTKSAMTPDKYTRYLEHIVTSLLDERGTENIFSTDDHPSLVGTFSPLLVREAIATQQEQTTRPTLIRYLVMRDGRDGAEEISSHKTYDLAETSIKISLGLVPEAITVEYFIRRVYTNKG